MMINQFITIKQKALQLIGFSSLTDHPEDKQVNDFRHEFKLISLVLFVLFLLSFAACNSPAEDVKQAEDNVVEANDELNQAEQDFALDMENYRKEAAIKIAANDSNIREFKARVKNDKLKAKSDYEKEIADLENKNTDMKKRIEDYKAATNEDWQSFKTSFKKEMDDLDVAVKRFFDKKE
jgi:hypothetical protein